MTTHCGEVRDSLEVSSLSHKTSSIHSNTSTTQVQQSMDDIEWVAEDYEAGLRHIFDKIFPQINAFDALVEMKKYHDLGAFRLPISLMKTAQRNQLSLLGLRAMLVILTSMLSKRNSRGKSRISLELDAQQITFAKEFISVSSQSVNVAFIHVCDECLVLLEKGTKWYPKIPPSRNGKRTKSTPKTGFLDDFKQDLMDEIALYLERYLPPNSEYEPDFGKLNYNSIDHIFDSSSTDTSCSDEYVKSSGYDTHSLRDDEYIDKKKLKTSKSELISVTPVKSSKSTVSKRKPPPQTKFKVYGTKKIMSSVNTVISSCSDPLPLQLTSSSCKSFQYISDFTESD
jgi:hypothetical protein